MESKLTVFLTELSFCTVSGSNSKFLILNESLLEYFIMQRDIDICLFYVIMAFFTDKQDHREEKVNKHFLSE